MTRYFFHVVSGERILEDDEGSELTSLEHAVEEARKDARALMSDAILKGRDISDGCMIISSSKHELLKIVPFAEALDRKC